MDEEPSNARISDAANSCLDLFAKYLDGQTLTQKDVAHDLRIRLKLWAAYTGAPLLLQALRWTIDSFSTTM